MADHKHFNGYSFYYQTYRSNGMFSFQENLHQNEPDNTIYCMVGMTCLGDLDGIWTGGVGIATAR